MDKIMTVARMREIQEELQAKYGDDWIQMAPENGHYSILWAVSEIGEMIDIVKKEGWQAIMDDADTRKEFIREIADVMMFMTDVCLCFKISPEELSKVYEEKHQYNMKRWEE